MSKQYKSITDKLVKLFEEEHGDCENTTCAMSHCMKHGYSLWALYLFSSSGAASDEFAALFEKLPRKRFESEAEAERAEFVESVPSAACPHCNAVVYEPEDCNYHCSHCGDQALFEVKSTCDLPDGVVESENDGWVDGFKVISINQPDPVSTIFKVAMKYGKEPSELSRATMNESIGSEIPRDVTLVLKDGKKVA